MAKQTIVRILAAASLGAGAAAGAAPVPPQALPGFLAGAEICGYFSDGAAFQNHIWRLAPNGTARAVFISEKILGSDLYREEGADEGRWFVDGGQFCVQWRNLFLGAARCFGVNEYAPGRVRLIGTPTIDGTISR